MFKDYNKYLSASLKVYLFLLVVIFIMKIVGLDYFGLDLDNKIINNISNFITSKKLYNNIFFMAQLFYYQVIIMAIISKKRVKDTILYCLAILPISYFLEAYKINLFGNFSMIADIGYYLITTFIFCKIVKEKFEIKRFIFVILFFIFIETISTLTRFRYSIIYVRNPIANLILNLDYLLMILITYKLYILKGGNRLWTVGYQVVVGLFSQMKKNLLDLPRNLQKSYSNFKELAKVDKATFIIYFTLSLIWNIFTIATILFIAKLNDTIIECIFILTSFWISKRIFGKAFHLKSMILCFVLSNVSYYILNRITTPIGISILIPIMLGVGLSYVTSKFVKSYKPLYRGMPVEEFDNTILRLVDKGSDKYNICYDFFIKKENAVLLGRKYNYTEAGIRKITSRINSSIKALK